jgi:DNA-binding protein WhiA
MSFTSIVKNEASKVEATKTEYTSELSAIINTIGKEDGGLTIVFENASVARRCFSIIKDLYLITPLVSVRKKYKNSSQYQYILKINKEKELLLNDLSIKGNTRVPSSFIYADEELSRAYLRGVFLAIGTISDPKTSRYHLEFAVTTKEFAQFLTTLLNAFNLKSKYIKKEMKYMVYIKEAEKISDFLRIIKAIQSLLYFEDIRIYRDHKNMTNRLNNCEQANVDKTIMNASSQLKDIQLIKENGLFDVLDKKIQEAAFYREKYSESSLTELSEIISYETGTKITKSGLNHRMTKIKNLANKIRNLQRQDNNSKV